ncbi:MAG: hypothetical protein LBB38_03635 [Puniceicoccales bacterium]|jgi:hypothetical protein|nr:hypothetical protein [Puniceicoccales bacterium]
MDTTTLLARRSGPGPQGGSRVPPPGGGDDIGEVASVIELQLLRLEHPWLEMEIVEEVHRLHDLGMAFREIIPFIERGIERFDAPARAAWEEMKRKREEMMRDPELRKTLAPQSKMEAELIAMMDKTDAMDVEFESGCAEQEARIAALKADAAASEARTKAMVDAVEKKRPRLFGWLMGSRGSS